MPAKSARRIQAEELCRPGLSCSEITAVTGNNQSTLSGWLRHTVLPPPQRARLETKLQANRAALPVRARPQNCRRYQEARERAFQVGAAIARRLPERDNVAELALAMLCRGEDIKSGGRLQLANMDPAKERPARTRSRSSVWAV